MASGSDPSAPLLGERIRLDRLIADVEVAELAAGGAEGIEERPGRNERHSGLLLLEAGLEGAAEVGGVKDTVDIVEDIVVAQVVAEPSAKAGESLRVDIGEAARWGSAWKRRCEGSILVAPAGVVLACSHEFQIGSGVGSKAREWHCTTRPHDADTDVFTLLHGIEAGQPVCLVVESPVEGDGLLEEGPVQARADHVVSEIVCLAVRHPCVVRPVPAEPGWIFVDEGLRLAGAPFLSTELPRHLAEGADLVVIEVDHGTDVATECRPGGVVDPGVAVGLEPV